MSVYVISQRTEVRDPEAFAKYLQAVPSIFISYGGKYHAYEAPIEVLEGNWQPMAVIIVEFETLEQAHACYNSPEYAPYKEMRHQATSHDIIIVPGAPKS